MHYLNKDFNNVLMKVKNIIHLIAHQKSVQSGGGVGELYLYPIVEGLMRSHLSQR